MKKLLAISFTFLFMLITFQHATILFHFKVNQEYIEKTFCVNKSKPEKQCHGKCKLAKDLEQTNDFTLSSYGIYTSISFVPTEIFSLDFGGFFSEEISGKIPFKEYFYAYDFSPKNLRPPTF